MHPKDTPAIPAGFCHCGCGQRTRIAPQTDRQKGWIKGEPLRFLRGHNGTLNKKAGETCRQCGAPVTRGSTICQPCFADQRTNPHHLPPPNPSGLCQCGCGKRTRRALQTDRQTGAVRGEYVQFVKGHVGRKRPDDWTIDRETGCWNWNGATFALGYGMVTQQGRRKSAHIVVYERMVGPVPDGLELDHLCRNPRCVNPDHLEPVTHAENIRRAKSVVMTPEKRAIATELRGTMSERAIARRLGVSRGAVHGFLSGRTWRDE